MLEAGRGLLDGLELASAHQWELAHRDLLGAEPFYDDDRTRLTVLVGLDDYEGLRGWVTGKPGTDGAVVIAGTTLTSVKLSLDVCDPDSPLEWERETQHGDFAFAALSGHDHGSVVDAFADAAPADRDAAGGDAGRWTRSGGPPTGSATRTGPRPARRPAGSSSSSTPWTTRDSRWATSRWSSSSTAAGGRAGPARPGAGRRTAPARSPGASGG